MRETLYIRLRETSPGATTAYVVAAEALPGTAAAGVRAQYAPLEQVLTLAAGRKTIVFIPGGEVRLTQVKVPARQPAKVLQAAPYLLEDQFAEDVETLHFALGARLADGSFPVAVVSRDSLDEWLRPFREQDHMPNALVPDTLALPWDAGAWTVLAESGQMTARCGAYSGFSCVPEDFELFLQMAGGAEQTPLRMLVTREVTSDFTALQRPVELLPGFDDGLEALVHHLRMSQAINLLQGSYSQRESFERIWRPWKLAASLAAAAFVLGVVTNAVDAWRLGREVRARESANAERFHQIFPNEPVKPNLLEQQVEQQALVLRGSGGQNGLFFLLQQASGALAATPGLTLNNMEFREGALFLDLRSSDLQSLEQLRGWFGSHPGAALDVVTAESGADGARFQVKLSTVRAA